MQIIGKVIICIIVGVFADVICIFFLSACKLQFPAQYFSRKRFNLACSYGNAHRFIYNRRHSVCSDTKIFAWNKGRKGMAFRSFIRHPDFFGNHRNESVFDSRLLNELRGGAADGASLVLWH